MAISDHDLELPAAPSSVGDARRFVGAALVALDAVAVSEVAALLTSELVTNAVVHAGGPLRVSVRGHAGTVRIAVVDSSTARPNRRQATDSAVTGRGLSLVTELAERWGVEPLAEGRGKEVWFELRA